MNPFNPTSPIGSRLFYGRKDIIKSFKYNVEDTIESQPINLALVGEVGIGKTSLLSKLYSLKPRKNKVLHIYLPLNEENCNSYKEVINCILIHIEKEFQRIKIPFEVKEFLTKDVNSSFFDL